VRGMAKLSEIIAVLDGLLDATSFTDFGPNGLQVEGGSAVTRLVSGVSASSELFEHASELGAELIWSTMVSSGTATTYASSAHGASVCAS